MVGLRISIQNAEGTPFYTETHNPTTSPLGVVSVILGKGSGKASEFESIPWEQGNLFLKLEVDPSGGSNYTPLGTSMLQAVPYALYAQKASEFVSPGTGSDDDPIFVVRNNLGQIVFAVYQTGVRVFVEDTGSKSTRGGFAVGGLSSQNKQEVEYLRVTPDSVRVNVNNPTSSSKSSRGGFAVGGLSGQNKSQTNNLFFIAPDSARIYVKPSPSKGTRGGFAVGGLSGQNKNHSSSFLYITPENSFIGQDAGASNTTGERNAFIGYQAGYMNSTGFDNIFLGNSAGYSNESGNSNIFMGTESGKSNVSGYFNVLIGARSGQNITAGIQNIAIGEQAGFNINTGRKNIFIGTVAGFSNTAGDDNVFIGNFAGNMNTGSGSVYIGRTSGMNNKTGSFNVFVGEQSGLQNIEGTGNVFLGKGAGGLEMGSNKLYIANSNTQRPLIYGEFDKANLEVGGKIKINDLMNLRPQSSTPGNPDEGDVFYDVNSKTLKFYNGSQWMELSAIAAPSPPSVRTDGVPIEFLFTQTARVNYTVLSEGDSPILEAGVVYGTTPIFDINSGFKIFSASPIVGQNSIDLSGLNPLRQYYVRSFAQNSQGVSLGNMISFTTPAFTTPTVLTTPAVNINQSTATVGGNVTKQGGTQVSSRGVCWNTSPNPTVDNNNLQIGSGFGVFSAEIDGLESETIYYLRAYAINVSGIAYGNEVVFKTSSAENTVSDIDNNEYNTVQIGLQTWMKENLKTTKYRDGSKINYIINGPDWESVSEGAYSWYNDNEIDYKDKYGALYNYFAGIDARKLCPTGWRIPDQQDWLELINYLGGVQVSGGLLKEEGTIYWLNPNTGATNLSGFSALPGGALYYGEYNWEGIYGFWLSTFEYNANNSLYYYMQYSNTSTIGTSFPKQTASSVRCIKE
jgi:uncharacterized protein (TIGR02145 family)